MTEPLNHFSRFEMYRQLSAVGVSLRDTERVVSISHSNYLAEVFKAPPQAIIEANYPAVSIDALPFPDESIDAVVSDQVLEHIYCYPNEAIAECHRVLKPGGYAIHTTCFMLPWHGSGDPSDRDRGDFWRYTPTGLANLHRNFSQIVAFGGWGNPALPLAGLLGLARRKVPQSRYHPVRLLATWHRPSYNSVVWIVAKK